MEFEVKSAIGMWDVAREAVALLRDRISSGNEIASRGASVLALSGELGAGKTTFTQALAGILGAAGPVQSPTYVIMKKHPLSAGVPWKTLVHIDAYRLKSAEDLAAIGWGELLADSGNLVAIEWPERVEGALPEGAVWLRFGHATPDTRLVRLD
jgi:tRNA threonylcarbamoyladenosine biosynthesis protein TsaE